MVWGHGKDIAKLGVPGKNEFAECTQRVLVQMKVLTWSVIHVSSLNSVIYVESRLSARRV